MRIHADTSALIAWFHPADEFAPAVTAWCRERSPDFCWNPLLRVELRHNLRRLSGKLCGRRMARLPGQRNRPTTQAVGIHRLSDLVEWGDELSARHAQAVTDGTWDFVHVAAAQHARAEMFITCDVAQVELARLAGLPDVHLFK